MTPIQMLMLAGLFLVLMLPLAWCWLIYLIKIVLNDEEVQEKIRRRQRAIEEKRREAEDRLRRRQLEQSEESEAFERSARPKFGAARKDTATEA